MSNVLVTGATGFVGPHLVRRLAQTSDSIVCLVRDRSRAAQLEALGARLVEGNVERPESLHSAVADVDVVYHLAGATVVRSDSEYTRVNEHGTRYLAEACARASTPPVLVYVSSLAAGGAAIDDRAVKETDPPAPVSAYGRSKLAAEHALAELAGRLPVTVLRPPIVFGPAEPHLLSFFKVVKRRGWAVVPGRRLYRYSFTHVEDLAESMLLAAERGQRLGNADAGSDDEPSGCYYVADSQQLSFPELGNLIAAALQRPAVRTIHVPLSLCWLGAAMQQTWSRVRGARRSAVTIDKIREARAGSWICSTDRARQELGFAPARNLESRIRETARWYFDNGWL